MTTHLTYVAPPVPLPHPASLPVRFYLQPAQDTVMPVTTRSRSRSTAASTVHTHAVEGHSQVLPCLPTMTFATIKVLERGEMQEELE